MLNNLKLVNVAIFRCAELSLALNKYADKQQLLTVLQKEEDEVLNEVQWSPANKTTNGTCQKWS